MASVALATFGQGFVALEDFKLAKLCFLLAAADVVGGIVMGIAHSKLSPWAAVGAVFVTTGLIGVLALRSWQYVDRKEEAKRPKEIGNGYSSPAVPPIAPPSKPSGPPAPKSAAQSPEHKLPVATAGKNESGGLEFKEVLPSKLGYDQKVLPETFTVTLGAMSGTFPTAELRDKVPFSRMVGFAFSGEFPLKIYFDENGEIKIDATIYQSEQTIGAVVKENEFAVLDVGWDRNWDDKAFEIVDEHKNPMFQIERVQWNKIQIRGLLKASNGWIFAANDKKLVVNPKQPIEPPTRLFQYPGSEHFHERANH